MPSIDGLVTGLDTTRIIEGLLSIQQQQIDRFQARRQQVVDQQTAFKGVEAALISLQGAVRNLSRTGDNAFLRKQVSSSDDTLLRASASNRAAVGVYRMRVTQLAHAHQVASQVFDSANAELAQGAYTVRVGNQTPLDISIDPANNTLQGFAGAVNALRGGISASVIQVSDGYRLLLTSNKTGQSNTLQISSQLTAPPGAGTALAFDLENPVQQAQDAQLLLGSGAGALAVTSESNQLDDLIQGLTFDLLRADPEREVALTASDDIETARSGVQDFVTAYNEVISRIEEQQRFDVETGTAGVLFGNRSLISIRDTLTRQIVSTVPGANAAINRLTALGLRLDANGKIEVRGTRLDDVLQGRVQGVGLDDVQRLFGVFGETDSAHVRFVRAGSQTKPSSAITPSGQAATVPYEVRILQAAEPASVVAATSLSDNITIDASQNELTIELDGLRSGSLTLSEGVYTPAQLVQHLQDVINADEALRGRQVTVALQDGRLDITSQSYGQSSEVTMVSGTALTTLGFAGAETDNGLDVIGHFIVQGQRENATGQGRLLIGNQAGGSTKDLQVEVNLTASQVGTGFTAHVSLTRGIASQLDQGLTELFDTKEFSKGAVALAQETFAEQIEAIDQAAEKMKSRFEARKESLLAEFARLESAVSDLQSIGNLLAVQLAGLPRINNG